MLEDAAARLATADEAILILVGYGLVVLGFVLAMVFRRRTERELLRAPFFALSSALYLAGVLLTGVWFLSFQALAVGLLWALQALTFLAIGGLGFLFGQISLARSRNAFGRNGFAILALIPLAGLVLLFKPSRHPLAPDRGRSIPFLSGRTGVAVGIVLSIAAKWGGPVIEQHLDAYLKAAALGDESLSISLLLRGQGLEATLTGIATQAELPVAVDEVTTLSRIEADGASLRRTFVVSDDDWSMDKFFRNAVIHEICGAGMFAMLLENGATIEDVYLRTNGSEIGRESVTLQTCSI